MAARRRNMRRVALGGESVKVSVFWVILLGTEI
jgi:hypothetical protein